MGLNQLSIFFNIGWHWEKMYVDKFCIRDFRWLTLTQDQRIQYLVPILQLQIYYFFLLNFVSIIRFQITHNWETDRKWKAHNGIVDRFHLAVISSNMCALARFQSICASSVKFADFRFHLSTQQRFQWKHSRHKHILQGIRLHSDWFRFWWFCSCQSFDRNRWIHCAAAGSRRRREFHIGCAVNAVCNTTDK